jgi:hypothetical protein
MRSVETAEGKRIFNSERKLKKVKTARMCIVCTYVEKKSLSSSV